MASDKPTLVAVERAPLRVYSEQEKRDAVALYFVHETQSKVGEILGIPQRTLSDWQKTEWWAAYTRELLAACKDKQGAGYRLIVEKSQREVIDRLDHGDAYKDKKGNIQRKPISAKDLTVIMAIATDKDRILRGEPTSISAKATNLADAAAEFAKIADGDKGVKTG